MHRRDRHSLPVPCSGSFISHVFAIRHGIILSPLLIQIKRNEHCQIHVSSRLGTTDIADAASRATRHQPYQGCEERPIIVSVGWSRVRVVACISSMT